MSVNIAAELGPPNESYTHHHYSEHVDIDDNKITHLVIDSWRAACAAFVSKDFGQTSCIIDGVPQGPTPTGRAQWNFITSRPYVIVEEWKKDHSHSGGPFHTERKLKVNVRVRMGFKVTSFMKEGKKAVWRAYPEVEAEQRGQLVAAINEARAGQAVRREPTVTFPDGYPKSA